MYKQNKSIKQTNLEFGSLWKFADSEGDKNGQFVF